MKTLYICTLVHFLWEILHQIVDPQILKSHITCVANIRVTHIEMLFELLPLMKESNDTNLPKWVTVSINHQQGSFNSASKEVFISIDSNINEKPKFKTQKMRWIMAFVLELLWNLQGESWDHFNPFFFLIMAKTMVVNNKLCHASFFYFSIFVYHNFFIS